MTPGPGDAVAAPPPDFVGVNYYTREIIAAAGDQPFGLSIRTAGSERQTTMGWDVYPEGLRDVLVRVHREYGPAALVVSENGASFDDPEPTDGMPLPDTDRRQYLEDHLAAAARAIRDGVPLTGFYAWSLLDNFEWERGFNPRFGLVHVDYQTQVRTVKQSGEWYRSFVREARSAQP